MAVKENDSLQDQFLALNLQLDECHSWFWYSWPRVRRQIAWNFTLHCHAYGRRGNGFLRDFPSPQHVPNYWPSSKTTENFLNTYFLVL